MHMLNVTPTLPCLSHSEEVDNATDSSTVATEFYPLELIIRNKFEGIAKGMSSCAVSYIPFKIGSSHFPVATDLFENTTQIGDVAKKGNELEIREETLGGMETRDSQRKDDSIKPQDSGGRRSKSPVDTHLELSAPPTPPPRNTLIADLPSQSFILPSPVKASSPSSRIPTTASEGSSLSPLAPCTGSERETEANAPTAQHTNAQTVSRPSASTESESSPNAAQRDDAAHHATTEELRKGSPELDRIGISYAAIPVSKQADDVHASGIDSSDYPTHLPQMRSPQASPSRDTLTSQSVEISSPNHQFSASSPGIIVDNQPTPRELQPSRDLIENKRKMPNDHGPRTSQHVEIQQREQIEKDASDFRLTKKQKLSEPNATSIGPGRENPLAFPCCDVQSGSSNPSLGQSNSISTVGKPVLPCISTWKPTVFTKDDRVRFKQTARRGPTVSTKDDRVRLKQTARRGPIASAGSGHPSSSTPCEALTSEKSSSSSSTNYLASRADFVTRTPMVVMPSLAMPNCSWPKKFNEDEDFDRQVRTASQCLV